MTRCLQKDARHRLRDIADARFTIEDSAVDSSEAAATTTEPNRRIMLTSLVTALLVVALGAGWWTGRRTATRPPAFKSSLGDVTLTQLTTDLGYEGEPTFAPDGETVAYVSDRTGNFEIFLRQASGGRDINLTNDGGDDVQPSFSPDGRQIAFVSSMSGLSTCAAGSRRETPSPLLPGCVSTSIGRSRPAFPATSDF